jgi:DnaJ-class molecular chaperone
MSTQPQAPTLASAPESLKTPHIQTDCSGCNGRGEVGGFISADSGYDTQTCPFCDGSGYETNPSS